MDLHTDGTYVKEITDWLMMTKIEEKNVQGGESAMLHLDDWESCDEFFKDPIGRENFVWGSPKSKNIDYKVEHPVFTADSKGLSQISYIDQFPEPKNMKQGLFLQKLSDALEGSTNKVITKLPVGSAIVANNYFGFMEENHLRRILCYLENYWELEESFCKLISIFNRIKEKLKKTAKNIDFYVVNLQHKIIFYSIITVILDVLLCYDNKAQIKLI